MATNYLLRHETLWLAKAYRATATSGHHAAIPGHQPTPGGAPVTDLRRLGLPLAASLGHWGEAALAATPTHGAPGNLTDQQREYLLQLLLQGARAHGFPNERWTLKRIAAVIQRQFGVRYHPAHAWKLLRRLGWSCQVPEPRPIQRDDQAMAHWQRSQWPAIKKSPTTWGPSRLPG
jgi:transposase